MTSRAKKRATAQPPRRGGAKRSRPASDRRARAARSNGKLGGRRAAKLPAEIVERIGAPPSDPAKLAAWIGALLAESAYARMTGKIGSELAADMRATAKAFDSVLAPKLQAQLERVLREDREEIATDDPGPQPEPVALVARPLVNG